MVLQCPYCQLNTAGQHEWNCPMNPININNANYDEKQIINFNPTINFINQGKEYLDYIENYLIEKGCDVENYNDPLKGITQMEAILKVIDELIKYKYNDK